MKTICCLLLVALLFTSCKSESEVSANEKASIADAISQKMKGYHTAIQNKDIAWIKDFFVNDSNFAFANDGVFTTDYDSTITKDYTQSFAAIKEMPELNFDGGKITVLSKEVATFCTPFKWYAYMNNGDTLRARGAFLFVFRKEKDQWKIMQAGGTHIYH